MSADPLQSAPPPRPPPPPPSMPCHAVSHRKSEMTHHNLTDGDDNRSRLLTDICKGTVLKKISITDNNNNKNKNNNGDINHNHDVSIYD